MICSAKIAKECQASKLSSTFFHDKNALSFIFSLTKRQEKGTKRHFYTFGKPLALEGVNQYFIH